MDRKRLEGRGPAAGRTSVLGALTVCFALAAQAGGVAVAVSGNALDGFDSFVSASAGSAAMATPFHSYVSSTVVSGDALQEFDSSAPSGLIFVVR